MKRKNLYVLAFEFLDLLQSLRVFSLAASSSEAF